MAKVLGHFGTSGRREVYEPNKFPDITINYVGTQAECRYSASVLAPLGWKVELNEGPRWTLTANLRSEVGSDNITPITTTGSYATKNWSFGYNTTQKELLHVNTTGTWLTQINAKDRVALDELIATPPKSGSIDWSSTPSAMGVNWSLTQAGAPFSGSTSSSLAACQTVWTLNYYGFKTIPINQQKIILSMTLPKGFDLTIFNQNIDRIYSKSSVNSEMGITTNFYNAMLQPSDPSGIVTPNGSTIPLLYGWQKKAPDAPEQGSVINLRQEWLFGLYAQDIYGTRL